MYIKVRVVTGAKKESVVSLKPGEYSVSVRVQAERGLANSRVLELLREHLGPSLRVIRIVSGHQSPRKVILVEGLL